MISINDVYQQMTTIVQILISIYDFHYTNQYSGRLLGDKVTNYKSSLDNYIMYHCSPLKD